MTTAQRQRVDEFLAIVRDALLSSDHLPAMMISLPADPEADGLGVLAVSTLDRRGQACLALEALKHLIVGVAVFDTFHRPGGEVIPNPDADAPAEGGAK